MSYKDSERKKAHARAYHLANRERILAQHRAYYQAHKEEAAAYGREYHAAHADEIAAYKAAYCAANRVEIAAKAREHYRANKDRLADRRLQRIYGITPVEYDEMLKAQGGGCAICGMTPEENDKRLAVDHDHKTNSVRGLLCSRCNTAIGLLGESGELCLLAARYLGEEIADAKPGA